MKKIITLFVLFFALAVNFSNAQNPIPYGISLDSIFSKDIYSPYFPFKFNFYKPALYDNTTSPILFAIHGSGGSGWSVITDLQDLAERRNALIIAPDFNTGYCRLQEPVYPVFDTMVGNCDYYGSASELFKQIYRHVLTRENRTYIPSYLIGFSAGGQFVSRYMLIRQAYPDSIPLQMAVSSSPYFYTFPTDTFNGVEMIYMCGFAPNPGYWSPDTFGCSGTPNFYDFRCIDFAKQYYNENYAVMVGTADTQYLNDTTSPCVMTQGVNRYERAKTFYNFCDSNATNIGTTLKWKYGEIPGVGHNENLMYNTVLAGDSMPLAERLLFETPHHDVPVTVPLARFYADTTEVTLPNATVHFYNTSVNAISFLWDFGDGTTSTNINPTHIYTVLPSCWAGTYNSYSVQLKAYSNTGCDNWNIKRHYIKVNDTVTDIKNVFSNKRISVFPNPATNECFISFQTDEKDFNVQLLNCMGQVVNVSQSIMRDADNKVTVKLNTQGLDAGIYFIKINGNDGVAVSRMIKE